MRGHGEGTITQRKDGRWQAQISLGDGKRKTLYGKTTKGGTGEVTGSYK